jgi:hypothetical protein
LKDFAVTGVFVEQPHILGVEGVVLLEDDVHLEKPDILCRPI